MKHLDFNFGKFYERQSGLFFVAEVHIWNGYDQ